MSDQAVGDTNWDSFQPPPKGPQGPLGNRFQFNEPNPMPDVLNLSDTVGPGTASFNGFAPAPPKEVNIDAYINNERVQEMVRNSPNPEDMRLRVENAVGIAKLTGQDPAEVMRQLGVYSEALYGTQDQRTVWEQTKKSLQLGMEQTEYSMLGIRAMMGNEEAKEQIRQFEFTEIGDYTNFLGRVLGESATQAPRFAAAGGAGLATGLATGAAGAATGIGAVPGFFWGFPKGTMAANMMMEAGFLYANLISLEGEQGERIGEGNALVTSLAYGALAGFLETVGNKMIAMPGGTRFVRSLSDGLGTGFSSFLARTATRFATASIGEGATEFTQELAQGYAQQISTAIENAKLNRDYSVQDYIEDQMARGEMDQDTGTALLNSPQQLSEYIEEQGGEEALGIGRPVEGGYLPQRTRNQIYSDAASAFVSAMIVGGVYGSVPSIMGGMRDTKAKKALQGEVAAIVEARVRENPDANLSEIINEVMEDPDIATQSERFIRTAAEIAFQQENNPERVKAEYDRLKRTRREWQEEDAPDAVARRFEDDYLEETRPEVERYRERLEELRQEGEQQTLRPPEDQALADFVEAIAEEQRPITQANIPDFTDENQVASFVRSPDMQDALKTYWIEHHAKSEGVSEAAYRELYRTRTNSLRYTIGEITEASQYIASPDQRQGLLDLAATMQQELNRVQQDLSLPSLTIRTQQGFSQDVRDLRNRVTELETEVAENERNFDKKDELAVARAELKVAELRAKDSSEIAARIQENMVNGFAFVDAQAKALSEAGIAGFEVNEALHLMQNATAEEIQSVTATPGQVKSSVTRKINGWMSRNANSILKMKTKNLHTPYAKGIKFIQSQITKARGTGNTDAAIRQVLTQEIAKTGRLDELYENKQISEVLKKPINKWTPMEMLHVKNLVDMLYQVGRREVKIFQENMEVQAEATRQLIAENLGQFNEYIEEVNQQGLAKMMKDNLLKLGPKRMEINLTEEQVELVNNYTSLELDLAELNRARQEYNERSNLFYWSKGELDKVGFDYDGFVTLYNRYRLLKYQVETAPTPRVQAEFEQIESMVQEQSGQIEELTQRGPGENKIGLTGEDMVLLGGLPGNETNKANNIPDSWIAKRKAEFKELNNKFAASMNQLRENSDDVYRASQNEKRKGRIWGEITFPHVIIDTLNGKRARYKGKIHETFIKAPLEQEAQAKRDSLFNLKETLKVMKEQDVKWNDLTQELMTNVKVQDAMYYYLANKNDTFAAMVKAENRLGDQQFADIVEALDDSYKKVAETMHTQMKKSFDEIRDVAQRVYGVDMGFINEWLPLMRNLQDDQQMEKLNIFETYKTPEKLRNEFILHRSEQVSGAGIRTDLASLYFGMMPKQRRFVRMGETMGVMQKVLNNSALQKQVEQTLGGGAHDALQSIYDRYANPNTTAGDSPIEHAMRKVTRNLVTTRLFLNLGTATKQIPSMLNYMRAVGVTPFMKSLAHTTVNFRTVKDSVFTMDPYIANRIMQIGAEEITAIRAEFGDKVVKKVQEIGLFPVRGMDQMVVLSGWNAAYQQGKAMYGNTDDAVAHARELTIRTQPDANPVTLPSMYTRSATLRFFLAFTQQPYKNLSLMMNDMPRSVRRTWEETAGAGRIEQAAATAVEASKWAATLSLQAAFITAATGTVGIIRGYGDEDELADSFLLDTLVNTVAWVPFVGSAFGAAHYGFEPSVMPFQSAGQTIYSVWKDIAEGELDWGTARGLAEVASMTSGLPFNRILSMYSYMVGD